jgi:hypothetical protein
MGNDVNRFPWRLLVDECFELGCSFTNAAGRSQSRQDDTIAGGGEFLWYASKVDKDRPAPDLKTITTKETVHQHNR